MLAVGVLQSGILQYTTLIHSACSLLYSCPPCTLQVYRAVLKETGEEVAVKVQRPGVEPNILRDLYIFRTLASFFDE